ncbi:MAG TPA: acyl carrier protein [Acetobacteraceae bacterium]|jgi:acyl carrier protein|nr:acyl carrier protein [Acetobacteraceae bacterium]
MTRLRRFGGVPNRLHLWHAACSARAPPKSRGSAQNQGTFGMATRHYQIREILAENGRLAVPVDSLDENADLFAAGLDSLAIVNVLMRLEEQFDIELPDDMLQRKSFSSIATIDSVVTRLTGQVVHT